MIELDETSDVKKDISFLSSKLESGDLKKRYKASLEVIQALSKEVEAIHEIRQSEDTHTIVEEKSDPSEATAIILASDWHIEELVDPKTINGLNTFNLRIAEKRADSFFVNSVKLVKGFQRDIKIKTIILWLGGDFISNNIHEELLSNTCLRPIEAIKKAQSIILAGINYLLTHTDCNLVIPTSLGNHSRITTKVNVSIESGNSLEDYMYCNLAKHFSNEARIKFVISKGSQIYLNIYKFKLRFLHGTHIRYLGGVGGLTIPANKAIASWNRAIKADYTCFGHLHTRLDGGNFLANGSLIGYNAYALSIKASYEPPSQTFFLLDKLRGKSIVAPIFLE